jgi:hypothetical protein
MFFQPSVIYPTPARRDDTDAVLDRQTGVEFGNMPNLLAGDTVGAGS